MDGYASKCLQLCVADLFRLQGRAEYLDKVRSICDNDAGSGYCGSDQEALNFDAVSQALVEQEACVLVYESPSVDALLEGKLYGPWKRGKVDGFCVGMLVWLEAEAHVLRGWNWNMTALQNVGVVDALIT